MSEAAEKVTAHYGSASLGARILEKLSEDGALPSQLTPEMLYPFDQLHARQIDGTREHLSHLRLGPADHLLDVGSGIGGPARYAAQTFGCRVTGIDLTPSFVEGARTLTALCGLDALVTFHEGDALAMPFAERTFDAASCHYVAMNIADKAGLLAEIRRVLRPGGRLVWSEVVLSGGDPIFPLPWARDPAASFLGTEEALRAAFDESGLIVADWREESDAIRAFMAAARASGRPPSASAAVLGEDVSDRFRNFARCFEEGRLGSILAVATR